MNIDAGGAGIWGYIEGESGVGADVGEAKLMGGMLRGGDNAGLEGSC